MTGPQEGKCNLVTTEPVLIYRLGSLGDAIIALPSLRKIAERFPDRERILLTNIPVSSKAPPMRATLDGAGVVDRYVTYPIGLRSPKALLRLGTDLKALGATTLVYLAEGRGLLPAWRDLLFFRSCGLSDIIGVPLTRSMQRNRESPETGEVEPEHERLARNIAALGPIDFEDRAMWDLRLSEAELRAGAETIAGLKGGPYLAINMGGKDPARDWGVERWTDLLRSLSARFGQFGLLVVGAADDSARARDMLRVWPGPGVDACGRLSPRESASALAEASIFIGHDSGPVHLASCVGVRCVALYGAAHRPRKWHPHGKHHRILHSMEGVSKITVADVLAAATLILDSGPGDARENSLPLGQAHPAG